MKVNGTLYLVVQGTPVKISEEALEGRFRDEQVMRKLIELDIEAKRHELAEMKEFIKSVIEEEKKYGLDVEKYPQELIEKIEQVEELDDEMYTLKESIRLLKTFQEARA